MRNDALMRKTETVALFSSVVYADVEQYLQSIRGNMAGRFVDSLDAIQIERARAGLTERFRAYERPDGVHVDATALLAVASR